MSFFERNNTLMIGFLLGATVPVLAYAGIEFLFEALTNAGIIDEVSESTLVKRKRTIALVALCFNILTVQLFRKRTFTPIINGIVTATLVYAVGWLLVFKILNL